MTADARPDRPGPLTAAAVLVGLQGLSLGAFGALELVSVDADRVALAVTTALFFLAFGGGLLLCARGLSRSQSWARGPVVATELIGLLLSFSFWGGATTAVAITLLVVCAAALASVLHPASTRALAADEG